MNKENFFIGQPVPFKKGIDVYPPMVNQVIKNPNYSFFSRVLTYSQEEVEDEFVAAKKNLDVFPTPFEFLLNNSYHSKEYEELSKQAFEFFTHQKVTFLYEQKTILFGDLKEIIKKIENVDELKNLVVLKEEEFFDFQNLIRESINKKLIEPPNPNEHSKIKAMKAKARYRDKIKAKQAVKNGITLLTSLAAICCMGLNITPLNVGEMSYVALETIISTYQNKEKYELDISSLLAGADSKKVKWILLITSFPFHQRGQLNNWLTRNPQRVMTMGISWENEVIKIELCLQNHKFDKSQNLYWRQ